MKYIQILECSGTLGTCCNDYGIVNILDIMRKLFEFLQVIVPIILIIMMTVQLIQMVANPEDKKSPKKIINKLLATVIIFFLPIIVNVVMNMLPENIEVTACWQASKTSAEVLRMQTSRYISPTDETRSVILNQPDEYQRGNKRKTGSSGSGTMSGGIGSAKGKAIVEYAKKFVGQRYVWGGTWNGELPYTGTDCSGFVQGVFKHHGINLTRTTYTQWADKKTYTLVNENNIQAGDLVMYDGHVGILTGNGNEIVHAKGSKYGVVVDQDYKRCSSHAILGIMRINGVN